MLVLNRSGTAAPPPTAAPQEVASDPRNEIPPPQESSAPGNADPAPTEATSAEAPSGSVETKPAEPKPKPPVDHGRPFFVPHPAPGPAASPPATAGGRKNCDPPYTIDAQGRHKYKRECM
jgi:serine/threonine-protein kinase